MKKLTFKEWLLEIPTPEDVIHDYYNDNEDEARKDYGEYLKEN